MDRETLLRDIMAKVSDEAKRTLDPKVPPGDRLARASGFLHGLEKTIADAVG